MKNSKMIILTLTLLFNSTFAFGNSLYEPNHTSFKQGFEAGLQALEFQAKQDGYTQKEIKLTKPYLLVYEIKAMPLNEALFLQIIAFKEGFETHLSKNFVSFGEFNREIDAKAKAKELQKLFQLNVNFIKIYKNKQSFLSYPYLWQDFHTALLDEAIKLGVIVKETEKIVYRNIIKEANTKPAPVQKNKEFTLKNAKAMSYKLINKEASQKDSLNYTENTLLDKKDYEFEKEIQTKQGETFIKVKNENVYFSILDVEFKE